MKFSINFNRRVFIMLSFLENKLGVQDSKQEVTKVVSLVKYGTNELKSPICCLEFGDHRITQDEMTKYK